MFAHEERVIDRAVDQFAQAALEQRFVAAEQFALIAFGVSAAVNDPPQDRLEDA